ncbi:MAG: hypothetical protein AB7G87_09895 [Clostridia bacterium]
MIQSIAIIKNGYDICRIIPNDPKNGKYNLKISLLGKPFNIELYKQFAVRATRIELDYQESVEISYHIGDRNYPVLIHLKEKSKNGEIKYKRLPLDHIKAPNVNSEYPMPLFRLVLPDLAIIEKQYSLYSPKPKKHRVLNIEDNNVVEFWMTGASFESEKFMHQDAEWSFAQMVMPIEFFAANTAYLETPKFSFFISSEARKCGTQLDFNQEVSILSYYYTIPDENLRFMRNKCILAFIENDLSDDILLNSVISKQNLVDNEYQNILMGLPTAYSLNKCVEVAFTDNKSGHTIAEWILKKENRNVTFHVERFLQQYLLSKKRYSERLSNHKTAIEERRKAIEQNVLKFRNAYDFCKKHFQRKFECIKAEIENYEPDADGLYNIPLDVLTDWFVIAEWQKPLCIYILLAKYLGITELQVSGWHFYNEGQSIESHTESGKEIYLYNTTVREHPNYRCWMQYDEFINIDFLCDIFNDLFQVNIFPAVLVTIPREGTGFAYPSELGVYEKINQLKLKTEMANYYLDQKEMNNWLDYRHGQLEQVYQAILLAI